MVNTEQGENSEETVLHFTVKSKHDKCMEVLLKAGGVRRG